MKNSQQVLTIKYQGLTLHLKVEKVQTGNRQLFRIQLDETDVFFEPGEGKNYRLEVMPGQNERLLQRIDPELLSEIALVMKAVYPFE